jgi:hypothetical protein
MAETEQPTPAANVAPAHHDLDTPALIETPDQQPAKHQPSLPVDPHHGARSRAPTIHVGDRVWVMVAGEPQPAHVLSIHHLDDHFDEYVVRTLHQPDLEGRDLNTAMFGTDVHRRLRLRDRDELPSTWQDTMPSRLPQPAGDADHDQG